MYPLAPTIISPITAQVHPIQCLSSTFIANRSFEKIAVVTILDPLNIRKVDPEIKLRPMNCKVEEQASANAGRKKI
jgi:hypothetical protein